MYGRDYKMSDVFDSAKRSEVMSRIRSKNTKPELIVFSYLRKQKVYFQRHYKKAPGSPDVALVRKKRAVFIDGDFWHGRTLEALVLRRGSEDDYWVKKIRRNVERDKANRQKLTDSGWKILVIWDSDIRRKRTQAEVLQLIYDFLKS